MPTILVVEDNELNSDMLAQHLLNQGFEVLLAFDGLEGIEKAKANLPDLILMDMGLPTINGWTASKQLKSCQETSNIPIIALTAYAMSDDRDKALAAGCDEYETKPIEFPRLLGKIASLLQANID